MCWTIILTTFLAHKIPSMHNMIFAGLEWTSKMSSSDDDCNQLKRRKRPRTTSLRSNEGGELTETKKLCCMCQSDSIPDIDAAHQQLLEYDNLRAHYFCLLFSSGLGQSGLESEGLHGFMPADVRRELKRGSRLKCVYCKKKGATVGCARQQCKKSYHLPCGIKNGSLQEFFDQVYLFWIFAV